MSKIEKVAVIGAGVMGAGIAAQVANAGVEVLLLDRPGEGEDRSSIARDGVARLLKTDPAPLMHKRKAKLITPGNTEDDVDKLAECDWIIEAIIEDIGIKQKLYNHLEKHRKAGSVVSSNTSTLRRSDLIEGMSENFCRDFLITHFFNPPRYMRLLELVGGKETPEGLLDKVSAFCDHALGKGVVVCKDTPGFIGNRIGIFWLQCAVVEAMDRGITIEVADAVIGRPFGIPKTGVFALLDMVGLDLMPHVLGSMARHLPPEDEFHKIYREPELIKKMIGEGYTGRKGKGGFYRLRPDSPDKVKEAINLTTGEYSEASRPRVGAVKKAGTKNPRKVLQDTSDAGCYAWAVMSRTLAYAASLVPEVTEDIAAIDEAMKAGYNWKYGPFELMDQIGTAWFAHNLAVDGQAVPPVLKAAEEHGFYRVRYGTRELLSAQKGYRKLLPRPGVLKLEDIKARGGPIDSNPSASLWDLGDGVMGLEFHSKMNSLNLWSLSMMQRAIPQIIASDYKALVVYNDGSNFSVGANIGLLMVAAKLRAFPFIDYMVRKGQETYQALKFAPFPVVSAPSGMALGGACELLLHSDAVQAHAETYTGLVEVGVGIIPGWGGCKEVLCRWATSKDGPQGPMPPVAQAFEQIGLAKVAKSAEEAREMKILRKTDGITMNRERVLADAKEKALELAEGYVAPEPLEIVLPGPSGRVALDLAVSGFRQSGKATPHDVVVSAALAEVLSGGDTDMTATVSEARLLELERKAFHELCRHPDTIRRVNHMLKTGKPLRN
ncbi:3-hydroxyacyl-CoA dehydrogenase/enoyl-CoA hydratase family protein [Kiloniella laminariae]|uniref:3-hydroxyacyl-CoA dehydrogenase/enoyl-CoA hydratase family protein n=1 Tax=Kiloniella laminariae TaxID=454162 RepID=UPI00037D5FE5|nr:3-hydroxyacyl-CoA dehydrogenase/enoyl-CoA hydratase family protein [Kiloniella laminariae]